MIGELTVAETSALFLVVCLVCVTVLYVAHKVIDR